MPSAIRTTLLLQRIGDLVPQFQACLINEPAGHLFAETKRQHLCIRQIQNISQQSVLTGVNEAFAPTVVVNGFQTLRNPSQQPTLASSVHGNEIIYKTGNTGRHQIKYGGSIPLQPECGSLLPPDRWRVVHVHQTKVTGTAWPAALGRSTAPAGRKNFPLHSRLSTVHSFRMTGVDADLHPKRRTALQPIHPAGRPTTSELLPIPLAINSGFVPPESHVFRSRRRH